MKTYQILFYIVKGRLRKTVVSALNYKDSFSEFERITNINKSNVLKSILLTT
jgi:hypothetical protein